MYLVFEKKRKERKEKRKEKEKKKKKKEKKTHTRQSDVLQSVYASYFPHLPSGQVSVSHIKKIFKKYPR